MLKIAARPPRLFPSKQHLTGTGRPHDSEVLIIGVYCGG